MFLRFNHLLQSCLRATKDRLPFVAREMHPSFDSLVVYQCPKSIGIFDGHPP